MKKYKDLKISAICAVDDDNGIGKDNLIPWYNPADLRFFKSFTINKIVVMGKNTWISLPKKPLPQRINVVISSSTTFDIQPDRVFANIEIALSSLHAEHPQKEIVIIGGSQLYNSVEPYIDEFVITHVPGRYDCDKFLTVDFSKYSSTKITYEDLNITSYKK
jgi:dihydrofolate reductase